MQDDNQTRIKGVVLDVNYNETKSFFERRAKKENLPNFYSYTMYQDNNPDIVLKRNKYEKNKILKSLRLCNEDVVLDLGCGIARWGEEVIKAGAKYIGVDFSEGLLNLARENLLKFGDNFVLINASFDGYFEALKAADISERFTKVLMTGVMMYVNDGDIEKGLNDLQKVAATQNLIYIKEPVSNTERLTLNHFFSHELDDSYNAIYRTPSEYMGFISKYIGTNQGYTVLEQGPIYLEAELNNRKDTEQYYFLIERRADCE